jgi:hypothetical protein
LQAVIVHEGLLHRVQFFPLGQAFNGGDIGAVRLDGEHGAGFHRVAVDMNDAGTALARIAPDVRTGKTKIFANELRQQRASFDFTADSFSVHGHGNRWHTEPPWIFMLTRYVAVWPTATPDYCPLSRRLLPRG